MVAVRLTLQLLGLHPLTLEDVLQQDPREKMDIFEGLGYYFICARALDESYFKYTPGNPSTSSPPIFKSKATARRRGSTVAGKLSNAPETGHTEGSGKKDRQRTGWGLGKTADKLLGGVGVGVGAGGVGQREKVEIIEDNPGKEGLEGVGVGAVNIYLVVFADGILSVSTPPRYSAVEYWS